MSPKDKLRKIADEAEPFAVWWDEGPPYIDHHASCTLWDLEEEDPIFELETQEIVAKCECWVGAAWRIRELAR